MARRIPNVDEMFDILSSMQAGKFATFCYVNVVKIRKTKKGIDLDAFGKDLDDNHSEGDDHWFSPLKKFQQDSTVKKNPIYAVISVTRYNLNWSTEESFNKRKKEFYEKKKAIDKDWEIYKEPKPDEDTEDDESNKFSPVDKGYGASLGNTENTKNTAYIHQNLFNAKRKTTYYVIGDDGQVKGEIPFNAIRNILYKTSDTDVNALKKLEKSDEEIKRYMEQIAALKFKYGRFVVDRILYIVATVNGEKIFYINEKLPSDIGKINVDSQSFIEMVRHLFDESCQEVTEAYRRFKNMIFESRIRKALHESLRKFKIIK